MNRQTRRHGLTEREVEVVKLVCEGKCSKEIAAVLGISPKTAENHRCSAARTLGTNHPLAMLRQAIRLGIYPCLCSQKMPEQLGFNEDFTDSAGGVYT